MILPELENLIKRLDFVRARKFKGRKQGVFLHNRPGRGMDFKDVRLYNYGDDIRFIDWNVSSRMGEIYIKEFHEENDRLVNLFLDTSASMDFSGAGDRTKFFIGFQFFAFLALLSLYSGDRINLVLYADGLISVYRNLRTRESLYKILHSIYQRGVDKQATTDHIFPFRYLKDHLSRKSISYIISDFAGIPNFHLYKPLREIHDLYGIRTFDTVETLWQEKAFRLFYFKHLEGGESDGYQSAFLQENMALKKFFRSNFLELRTDSEMGKVAAGFLARK